MRCITLFARSPPAPTKPLGRSVGLGVHEVDGCLAEHPVPFQHVLGPVWKSRVRREPEGSTRAGIAGVLPLKVLEPLGRSHGMPACRVSRVSSTVGELGREAHIGEARCFELIQWCSLHMRPCDGSTVCTRVPIFRICGDTQPLPQKSLNSNVRWSA